MYIDISKFFDFEGTDMRRNPMDKEGEIFYDILLTSKSTGEVITITLDSAHYSELLMQMASHLAAATKLYEEYKRKNEIRNIENGR